MVSRVRRLGGSLCAMLLETPSKLPSISLLSGSSRARKGVEDVVVWKEEERNRIIKRFLPTSFRTVSFFLSHGMGRPV